jgi:hypothetical protein
VPLSGSGQGLYFYETNLYPVEQKSWCSGNELINHAKTSEAILGHTFVYKINSDLIV